MQVKLQNTDKAKATSTVDKSTLDYSKDPVFIKKQEDAIAFLKKAGLPERLSKPM